MPFQDDSGGLLPELVIDEKESELHRMDSLSLLLYTFLLTLTVLTVWLFKHRRFRYLHETGLAILYGLIIGAIIRYGMNSVGNPVKSIQVHPENQADIDNVTLPDFLLLHVKGVKSKTNGLLNKTLSYSFVGEVKDFHQVNEIDQKATFDPEIFFNVLLPPIIFEAGYSMKRRNFFRNIGSILTFAFAGTAISSFAVGGVMFGVTRLFSHLQDFRFLDALHFGALISATDPVTVLAIFNDLNVDVTLYALVFGESVLNDAVAIVMTRTLEDYEESLIDGEAADTPTYVVILNSILEFCLIFGASFLVGCAMACATALLTKFTHIRQFPQLESTLFIIMSYASFLLAEVLNLTGIVSVLFCGICQAHYTYNNLSVESKSITKQFFDLLNFMAENFIFSYIGVSMFTFPKHKFDPGFISAAFFAIIIGRALNIYPLSFILNLGRKHKISFPLQNMLMFSGLRGAIAFALAIRNTLSESRQMILTTTLLIVIGSVIFCGGWTLTVLTKLGIPLGVNEDEENESAPLSPSRQYGGVENATAPPNGPGPGKSWIAKIWSGFDARFMKPFLTHSNPTLMETMPGCCLPLARFLTTQEQLAGHPAMQFERNEEDLRHCIDPEGGENPVILENGAQGLEDVEENSGFKQFPSNI